MRNSNDESNLTTQKKNIVEIGNKREFQKFIPDVH